jgi:hypothetical protein
MEVHPAAALEFRPAATKRGVVAENRKADVLAGPFIGRVTTR